MATRISQRPSAGLRIGFVGTVEQFDASLVMMAAFYGFPWLGYTRKWSAPTDGIKRRLLDDPASREMLQEANREDTALFRYVADEVLPRQEAAYGPSLAADVEAFREENGSVTRRGMNLRPRYAWYVTKWRLAYQPWVDRKRAAHRENASVS